MSRSSVAVVIPVGSFDDNLEQQVRAVLDQKCRRPFEIVLAVNNPDPTMAHAVDRLVGSIGDQRLHIVDSSDVRGAE